MSHKETVNKVLDQLLNTIEEQNETIRKLEEKLKGETERLENLWINGIKENNDLNRRIVKLGYNPLVSSYLLEDTFKTLEEDPLDQKMLDLFKD
mgnify:FL=1